MQKYFEKIKERLEEKKYLVPVNRLLDDIINDKPLALGQLMAYAEAIFVLVVLDRYLSSPSYVTVAEYASTNAGLIALPKEAFDRMIARMESESERDIYEEESLFINVRDAARIIKEIVVEYQPKGEG